MTREIVGLETLECARQRLFSELPSALSADQSNFLLSLAKAEPKWDLMQCDYLRELPAIQWRLQNLEKLKRTNRSKFEQQANLLGTHLKQKL